MSLPLRIAVLPDGGKPLPAPSRGPASAGPATLLHLIAQGACVHAVITLTVTLPSARSGAVAALPLTAGPGVFARRGGAALSLTPDSNSDDFGVGECGGRARALSADAALSLAAPAPAALVVTGLGIAPLRPLPTSSSNFSSSSCGSSANSSKSAGAGVEAFADAGLISPLNEAQKTALSRALAHAFSQVCLYREVYTAPVPAPDAEAYATAGLSFPTAGAGAADGPVLEKLVTAAMAGRAGARVEKHVLPFVRVATASSGNYGSSGAIEVAGSGGAGSATRAYFDRAAAVRAGAAAVGARLLSTMELEAGEVEDAAWADHGDGHCDDLGEDLLGNEQDDDADSGVGTGAVGG